MAGDEHVRPGLVALFESWGWQVVGHADDDLGALAEARRTRPDLVVIHGTGEGAFGDLDLARESLGCRIVSLLDVPQQLAGRGDGVLSGLPAADLRERLLAVLDGPAPAGPGS